MKECTDGRAGSGPPRYPSTAIAVLPACQKPLGPDRFGMEPTAIWGGRIKVTGCIKLVDAKNRWHATIPHWRRTTSPLIA
jgi:hypothetical protein